MRATFSKLAEAELNDAIAYYDSEDFGLWGRVLGGGSAHDLGHR